MCRDLLERESECSKILPATPPSFQELSLPYDLYTDEDIEHRVVYVEASRGCPYSCEFCLSSLARGVRYAPMDDFFAAMKSLLDRGVRKLKFVDRTFNVNTKFALEILQFFRREFRPGLFLHFEMVPDRFDAALREVVADFPEGALQFEVGVQTFDPVVSKRIGRPLDPEKVVENLTFLRRKTGVHIHSDLIVGLPGESLDGFAAGFDKLVGLNPHEIQVGILKRLRGTPIVRHDREFSMRYQDDAPYEILATSTMSFSTIRRLHRFSAYWDLMYNSGNFVTTLPRMWSQTSSSFEAFADWSDWLYERSSRNHAISLHDLMKALLEYLSEGPSGLPSREAAASLWEDYQRSGRSDKPSFLKAELGVMPVKHSVRPKAPGAERQRRHLES